ncbi:hypothetical protein [Pantoea sp.]|uniref:hyaluronate lyase N-terminal domain-containing protein n=1 Tax=Pantoea sp. TaxID=69393 RepID=UPI00290F32D4|nr:hypothetical protein [Pantoea sp.]MDU5473791.1 hypothetical protein [Pantoea sp.]
MAASIQLKRGATAKVAAYTPLSGELVLDTTTNKLYAGDGSKAGGNQIVASKKGVSDGSAASSGEIGEYISAQSASSVNLSTASTATIASISLTAGDWDVDGVVQFSPTGATNEPSQYHCSISTTSGAAGSFPNITQLRSHFTANGGQTISTPRVRLNLTATTTVYVEAGSTFPDGTMPATGFIRARRVR